MGIMPRAKNSKQATTSTPAAKKQKRSKTVTKGAEEIVTDEVVVAPPVVAQPVVASTEVVDSTAAASQVPSELQEASTEFLGKLNQLTSQLSGLKTEFRSLEKKWSRE